MRKITRAAAGAALGLVLTSSGFVVAANAATAGPDLPSIPGATAENPITNSSTGIYRVQDAASSGERDGLRVFETGFATPSVVATSSVRDGTLKVLDQQGHVLCTGDNTTALPNRYSCDLDALASGPQVITASVVRPDGTYSTPVQAHLDAFAAVPVVDDAQRDGDDLVVRGHANKGVRIEASLDGRTIVASADAGPDGAFEIRIPGGATAEQPRVRGVNDDVPASTPNHDQFATSNWAAVDQQGGEEQLGDGDQQGGGEQPGDGDQQGGGEDAAQPNVGTVTNLHDGDTVHTALPTFEGTARPGSKVAIGEIAGPSLGVATADAQGNWSEQLGGILRVGDNHLVVRYQQPDGSWVVGQRLTIEYVAAAGFEITTPTDGSTVSDARPTITGVTRGSYRQVQIADGETGSTLAFGKTDADGAFSIPFREALDEGRNDLDVSYQTPEGTWKHESYTLTYAAGGEQPGEGTGEPGEGTEEPGEGTEQPGEGTGGPGEGTEQPGEGTEQPGDGESATEFSAATTRIDPGHVNVEVRGPEGTEATVTANGTTKTVTLDDEEYRNVVVDAPAKLTTTVTVTAKVGDETVERILTVGDGYHAADALEATVVRTSAFGTAELTVWGMPTGIGGLTATEDGRRLALGAIGADGEGSLSLSGLAKGDHVVTVEAGGKQTQVSFHI